jgi:hypothetical protein
MNDVKKRLGDLCILNGREEEVFLSYLDPNKKGFVDFAEFSGRVKSNMVQNDFDGANRVIPYITPSREVHQQTLSALPEIKRKTDELKKSQSPDFCMVSATLDLMLGCVVALRRTTRFGSNPPWKNTFELTRPEMATQTIFAETSKNIFNEKVRFQQEEKEVKESRHLAKLERIREHQRVFRERIEEDIARTQQRADNKVKEKALRQTLYEQVHHTIGFRV